MSRPRLWAVGHLTIDDVVMRDGRTMMGNVAGAAVYAALGARLVGSPSGVVSRLGSGIPEEALKRLAGYGVLALLNPVNTPAIQQWALYEQDGTRTYVLHPESGSLDDMSPVPLDGKLPPDGAVHVAPMLVEYQREWCLAMSRRETRTTLDPHPDSCSASPDVVMAMLPQVDAFLPSELEASHLFDGDPLNAVRDFCRAGARIAGVKLGERGSVIGTNDDVWHVPAFPAEPVDVTGAGDSFCGAFAAILARGSDPMTAARWATAAASVVVEAIGDDVPDVAFSPGYVEDRMRKVRPELLTRVSYEKSLSQK